MLIEISPAPKRPDGASTAGSGSTRNALHRSGDRVADTAEAARTRRRSVKTKRRCRPASQPTTQDQLQPSEARVRRRSDEPPLHWSATPLAAEATGTSTLSPHRCSAEAEQQRDPLARMISGPHGSAERCETSFSPHPKTRREAGDPRMALGRSPASTPAPQAEPTETRTRVIPLPKQRRSRAA